MLGQGSIGRRHAGLLVELGHDVAVFDPNPDAPAAASAERSESAEKALDGADAAVIASPSSEHVADARLAIERGLPTLVEKPLALDEAGAAEIDCLAREREVIAAVAMNLRHHPGVQAVAERLTQLGSVLRASAWCGSWLPGWRCGSDYRTSYSARSELGGGVLLDVAVHELDYLLWLVGPARSVTARAGRVSDLETDVEDVAQVLLELEGGGAGQVTVDYFDRSYHRGCRIVGSDATLDWSWEDERLVYARGDGEPAELVRVESDVAPAYRRQLELFTSAVRGEPVTLPTPAEARAVLAVVDAARASAESGCARAVAAPPRLRGATAADADLLRAWRNDPDTRRWSRSEAEVGADEHASWFGRVLSDASTQLWVAEDGSGPYGQVRLDPAGPGGAELSVTLAPRARGRGLAAPLLIEAAGRALAEPAVERLVAFVKPGNDASLRAFGRAGFRPAGEDDAGLLRLERVAAGGRPAESR